MSARYSKHTYELVAACLRCADGDARTVRQADIPVARAAIADIAQRFALEFELDNPRFNRARFLTAYKHTED